MRGAGLPHSSWLRVRDATEVDHRLLHRDFDALAATGGLALQQRGQDADRHVQPGAGVADGRAGLEGRRRARRWCQGAADRLGDHVEGQEVAVRTVWRETLDLGVDDARIDALDLVVAEAEALDDARPVVLDEDVGVLDQLAQQLAAALDA